MRAISAPRLRPSAARRSRRDEGETLSAPPAPKGVLFPRAPTRSGGDERSSALSTVGHERSPDGSTAPSNARRACPADLAASPITAPSPHHRARAQRAPRLTMRQPSKSTASFHLLGRSRHTPWPSNRFDDHPSPPLAPHAAETSALTSAPTPRRRPRPPRGPDPMPRARWQRVVGSHAGPACDFHLRVVIRLYGRRVGHTRGRPVAVRRSCAATRSARTRGATKWRHRRPVALRGPESRAPAARSAAMTRSPATRARRPAVKKPVGRCDLAHAPSTASSSVRSVCRRARSQRGRASRSAAGRCSSRIRLCVDLST